MKSLSLIAIIVSLSSFAVAGNQWMPLKTTCFEAGNGMDAERKSMELCQQFLLNLNKMATDNFVVQGNCKPATVSACGYGYNLKAQIDIKVLVLEDPKTCN